MTTYTITGGHDTYTDSAKPNETHATWATLRLAQGGTTQNVYVYLPLPNELVGQTVVSAVLTARARTTASATVVAKAVTSSWSDAMATHNRQPTVASSASSTPVSTTPGSTFDVTVLVPVLAFANTGAWQGVQLSLSAGGPLSLYAFDDGSAVAWTLTVVTSESPEIPTALVPNGTTVGAAKPILSCDFTDNGGLSTDMAAINVQIDPAQNSASPAFDSGTVASTLPILDLATTAYAGIGSGATTYWRVRVQDGSGLWSGWSDWAAMTYRAKPTITLLTPAAGVLWDPTSDILASTSANMSAYRVQITEGTDRTNVRFDTGKTPANPSALTSIQVGLPEKYQGSRILIDDRDYQLHVMAWDTNLDRQGTPGVPAYTESWSTFHFDDDLAVSPVATLTADQNDQSPAVTLTWTRAAAPDAWVVLRDSKVIARLDPADVISGVSTYSWTDPHPRPWIEHAYNVKAINGGHQGDPGPTATITPNSFGIWLYTQDGQSVVLGQTSVDQLTVADRRDTYKPIGLRYDVDIVHGFEGLSGTLTGLLTADPDDDQQVADSVAILLSIKENPSTPVRLIYGMFSGDVLLRNVSVTPSPMGNVAAPVMSVSFGVNHVADFDSVI